MADEQVKIELTDESPVKEDPVVIETEEKEESKSSASDVEQLRNELRETQQRLAYFAQQQGGNRQQSQEPAGKDEWDRKEDQAYERIRSLQDRYTAERNNKTLTKESALEYEKQARELENELSNIRSERSISRIMPALQAQSRQEMYRAKYPEIYANPRALAYAKAEFDKSVQAMGKPNDDNTLDAAMNEARRAFNMPGYSKPSEKDKSSMSGTGGGGNRKAPVKTVRLGKAEKQMALAMYLGGTDEKGKKIEENEAYRRWANGPGKKAMEKNREKFSG